MIKSKSFTLVEMIIVVAIIATLSVISVPYYKNHALRVKSFAAQKYIMLIRDTIESYTIINTEYPENLTYLTQGEPQLIPYVPCTTEGTQGNYKGYRYRCQEITGGSYQISSSPLTKNDGSFCWRIRTGGHIQKKDYNTKNGNCNGPWISP